MTIQNYLRDKLEVQFLDFFVSQYSLLFVDGIYWKNSILFDLFTSWKHK